MLSICFYYIFLLCRNPRSRVGVALVVCGAVLAGCAGEPREPPPSLTGGATRAPVALGPLSFTPFLSFTGARLVAGMDRTGTPAPGTGALGFTRFIRPLALGARGGEVAILDAGAGTVYRYDPALNQMVALRNVPVQQGGQLALGADYSVYVIDPPNRRVLRVARSGQVVTTYSSPDLQRPVDVAVDEARGLVFVADGGFNQILAFHALGGAASILHVRSTEGTRLQAVGHIALGPDAIYVADPLCRCVGRVDYNGRVLNTFGQEALGAPGPLAVDRYQRVFVIDQFERVLKVFYQGKLTDTLAPRRFAMQQIDDVWIDDNVLYLADGLAGRVEAQRMAEPRRP